MNEKEQPYNGKIDEALLTAFALEQLEGPERALVEAALKTDRKAQGAVEEIRAVAGHLRDAAAHDEEYAPSASLREMIEERLEGMKPAVVRDDATSKAAPRRRHWAVFAVASAVVLFLAVTIPSLPKFRLGTPSDVAMDMTPSPQGAAPTEDSLAAGESMGESAVMLDRAGETAVGEMEETAEKSSAGARQPGPGLETVMGKSADGYAADQPVDEETRFSAAKAGVAVKSGVARSLEEPNAPPAAKGSTMYRYADKSAPKAPVPANQPTYEAQQDEGSSAALADQAPPMVGGRGRPMEEPMPSKAAPSALAGAVQAPPTAAWSHRQAAGPVATPVPYPTAPPSADGQVPLAQSQAMPHGKSAGRMAGAGASPSPESLNLTDDPFSAPAPPTGPAMTVQTAPKQQVGQQPQPEAVTRMELMEDLDVRVLPLNKKDVEQVRRRLNTEAKKPQVPQSPYGPTASPAPVAARSEGAGSAPSESQSQALDFGTIQRGQPTPPSVPAIALDAMPPDAAKLGRGTPSTQYLSTPPNAERAMPAPGGGEGGYGGGMGGQGGYGGMMGGYGYAEAENGARPQESEGLYGAYGDAMLGVRSRAYTPAQVGQQFNLGTEQYAPVVENPFESPITEPESTVSADVDTASYPNVRRFLENNQAPPPGAVRIEEMVNYFAYDYPRPKDDSPFSVSMETASCPWNETHRLARIGLKAKEIDPAERGPSNLVFLLDVSGSMRDANKLPLVKDAMSMLVDQLTEDDRVSIVTYAGEAGLVLEPTEGTNRKKILDRIEALKAGGSTHGSAGIQMAYDQAMAHFVPGGNNRVILCTDGDLNVGITDDDELVKLIQQKASSGVFLTVVGFGTGNLKDAKLEQLADKGNGEYAYVDGLKEAKKVFVEQVSGSLVTVAKDVKIQIEFNPAKVQSYRLIGYENRRLATQDFNDDMKDAGEIGAGHTVTFLYEIVPSNLPVGEIAALNNARSNLRYQQIMTNSLTEVAESGELLALKLRYKLPDEQQSRLLEFPVKDSGKRFGEASSEFRFAAAVAAFGMLLRGSQYNQGLTFSAVEEFAAGAAGNDSEGRRAEFVDLVRRARTLYGDTTQVGADAARMLPSAASEIAPAAEAAPAPPY